jgi:CRP-like cAMP-binding protein
MPTSTESQALETLRKAIKEFGARNPGAIHTYTKGHQLIKEGDEAKEFFLIEDGLLVILVKDPVLGFQRQIVVRGQGEIIGETAVLQRRGRRNATVEVLSERAVLIRLSNDDFNDLMRGDATVQQASIALREIADRRLLETFEVISSNRVTNKVMTVLMGDIHAFSALGERLWDHKPDIFLFEFIEAAGLISLQFDGSFEDQGDGFKILFQGENHVGRAVGCGASLKEYFVRLRQKWQGRAEEFKQIGLGIGICTDCMSMQLPETITGSSRVAGHAINIAAAIAKHQTKSSDTEIYLDQLSEVMFRSNEFKLDGRREVFLDRLDRTQMLYRLISQSSVVEVDQVQEIPLSASDDRMVVLFLASEPSDAGRLRLGQEAREIQEKLQLSRFRDRFDFQQRYAARPSDLSQALLDLDPTVVHFAGHGAGIGGLSLEGIDGKSHVVTAPALSQLFKQFAVTTKCVLLNACHSKVQADAISQHIDHVIGMSNAISDRAAIAFAVGFYQALGAGRTFEDACHLGRAQIFMITNDEDEAAIPVCA